MRIFIRTGESLVSVDCEESSRLSQISEEQLFWGGKILDSEMTIAQCGLSEYSTLEALDDLLGGKKKKKKKAYSTPKKKAHKKKKVKLAALNIYKVDKTQKVTRTKKVCEKCGPGTFMAKHANRFYCGKCFLTILAKA